jgi:SAM-dependent methyltransferase
MRASPRYAPLTNAFEAMIHSQQTPSFWFTRFAPFVAPGTRLLDVACGAGRHAKFFAARGVNVTAVDRDIDALSQLRGIDHIVSDHRDLENETWPYAPHSFDAVLVSHYLWRPTFDVLLATIKPGGLLLYETFMDGNEAYGKPSRADFLLRSNELLTRTRDAFQVIAFEEGEEAVDGAVIAVKQKICAWKLA